MTPQYENELRETFKHARVALRGSFFAKRLWYNVFTVEDRERLGNDLEEAWRNHGTAGMWMHIHGVSADRAIVDVAYEIRFIDGRTRKALLEAIDEPLDGGEAAQEHAIANCPLVLVERPRDVYWRGDRVPVEWQEYSALWEFLWQLGAKAKTGGAVYGFDFGRDLQQAAKHRKNRLVKLDGFPAELANRIVSAGRNSYRLALEAHEVRQFVVNVYEHIEEVRATESRNRYAPAWHRHACS